MSPKNTKGCGYFSNFIIILIVCQLILFYINIKGKGAKHTIKKEVLVF